MVVGAWFTLREKSRNRFAYAKLLSLRVCPYCDITMTSVPSSLSVSLLNDAADDNRFRCDVAHCRG